MPENVVHIHVSKPWATGSGRALEDMRPVYEAFSRWRPTPTIVNIDFKGVSEVDEDYVNGTIGWALSRGKAHVLWGSGDGTKPLALRPLPLYPVISNCTPRVVTTVHGCLCKNRAAAIRMEDGEISDINSCSVLGCLDLELEETLRLICSLGEATAEALDACSAIKYGAAAWSARLFELHLMRLVVCKRDPATLLYSPVINGFRLHAAA